MAKKKARQIIILQCSQCGEQNYTTTINKRTRAQKGGAVVKLELSKYCKRCRKHTVHEERKVSKAKK